MLSSKIIVLFSFTSQKSTLCERRRLWQQHCKVYNANLCSNESYRTQFHHDDRFCHFLDSWAIFPMTGLLDIASNSQDVPKKDGYLTGCL